MIFKITENDLNMLRGALEEALKHINYNSYCFSCSDIRRAEAFNADIERVFTILADNSINIFKGVSKEFKQQFKGYYSEEDFSKIETPEKFEILLYSDAIWRASKDLLSLKYANEDILKIEKEHFTKYWSVITHGCAYDISPTKAALLEFSKISYSLKRVLHFVLPEIKNCEIKSIKAVLFDENELELEILYIKESEVYSLYVYETPYRADVIVSLNNVALRIYPTALENQVSIMFHDNNFCNYFEKMKMEDNRLKDIALNILSQKLDYISNHTDEFKSLDSSSLDGKTYQYWVALNQLEYLRKQLDIVEKDSNEYLSIEEDIYYLDDSCSSYEDNIIKEIFESVAPENFANSIEKLSRQHHYMLNKDCIVKDNKHIDYVFDFLSKDYYKNVI